MGDTHDGTCNEIRIRQKTFSRSFPRALQNFLCSLEVIMALTIQELLDNPGRASELYLDVETCVKCKIPLQGMITGKIPVPDGKHICEDCFYEEIGKEIDEHPIGCISQFWT